MITFLFQKLKACCAGLEKKVLGPVSYYRRRGAIIGDVPIFSNPIMGEPHLCEIGNNVWVTARVSFINHDGGIAMLHRAGLINAVNVVGKITVNDNVFIGTGSIIMGGVAIGPNAIIASGSVVTKDVPPNIVVGGCPAHQICSIEEYLQKYQNEDQILWIENESMIKDAVIDFFMKNNNLGKKAIYLRHGKTRLTE